MVRKVCKTPPVSASVHGDWQRRPALKSKQANPVLDRWLQQILLAGDLICRLLRIHAGHWSLGVVACY